MKTIIPSSGYTLDVAAKKLTLTGLTAIDLGRLLVVADDTLGRIVYTFGDSSASTATVAGNAVTFSALPASAANTDALTVIYDWQPTDGTPPAPEFVVHADAVTTGSVDTATVGAAVTSGTLNGAGSVGVQLGAGWTGTVAFQGSTDGGGSWFDVPAVPVGGSSTVTSTTAGGRWTVNVAGLSRFRVSTATAGTGSATVTMRASTAQPAGLPAGAVSDTTVAATAADLSAVGNTVAVTGLNGAGAVAVLITGTWTGTVSFQGSVDGTVWAPVVAVPATGGPAVTSTTTGGTWIVPAAGLNAVRAITTATGTGIASVALRASAAQPTLPTVTVQSTDRTVAPASIAMTATGGTAPVTALNGAGSVTVQITGTWTGTIGFEASTDGTVFVPVQATPSAGGAPVTSTTTGGSWTIPAGGWASVRAVSTVAGTGSATVAFRVSTGHPPAAGFNRGAVTNRSGTITAANTAQTIAAANPNRRFLLIAVPASAGSQTVFVRLDGTPATTDQNSLDIAGGGQILFDSGFVPTSSVSVTSATAGVAFHALEG